MNGKKEGKNYQFFRWNALQSFIFINRL